MNLMRARFARAACGMSSRFASPRLIFRSRDFKAESCPGLNELWRSGFLATSSRAEQPQQHTGCASHSASTPAVARRLAQAARIASLRGVAGRFSFSDSSVVVVIPPLKIPKISRHKIMGYKRYRRGDGNGGQQVSARVRLRGPPRSLLLIVDPAFLYHPLPPIPVQPPCLWSQCPVVVSMPRNADLLILVGPRSEEHTSELQSPCNLVCRFL